ncbi:MAG TPA: VWA domain-containing protein [Candidatus Limnocylindrales bacterium]|jgi:Ca-activated chloride channel family protein|nr:VWA domain-containing protein [Candidatus Limnocylindrales bacterium]
MSFAHPNILFLLLVFPPLLMAFLWWSGRKRQQLMTQFIQARLLPGLVAGVSTRRQRIRSACLVAAVACLIVALGRPQWGFAWQEVKQRGVDVVVAIDVSKSMLAQDIAPNRLARAKLAAMDLMQVSKGDRLGLVAFAGSAFLQCPLTIDDVAFRQSLDALDVNTIPEGGTAIAEAIETTETAFKEGDNHRVLVLMTDGEDHDSGALEAAQKAAKAGLRIYTIGIGTADGELLRIKNANGQDDYIRDEQGNVVKSHLNESLLREIAGASEGGFYLPLRGAKTIDSLYSEGLSKLPKSEHQQRLIKQFTDRYQWPLGLAILLVALEMVLPERKKESARQKAAVAKPVLQAAVLIGLALLEPRAALGSTSSALREYKSGKYEQSLKEYEQLLTRNADDSRLHFNAGAAAYRSRQFDIATKQFNEALASQDVKLQQLAYYNRGNALYRLGEGIPDPKKKTDAWEKALKDYDLSLKLNPQDADAKYNREFVKKRLEELKQQQQQKGEPQQIEPSEEAKKAKAAADEAVNRREYGNALDIMQKQLEKDPTTAYYGDFIQRLKEVTGVQDTAPH